MIVGYNVGHDRPIITTVRNFGEPMAVIFAELLHQHINWRLRQFTNGSNPLAFQLGARSRTDAVDLAER